MNSVAAVWEGGRHVSRASRIHGRDARQRDQSGLANEAYLVLRNRIVDGELLVGQRLSRRQIATDVGISALPVSLAMIRLEVEGFVESRPRRGTRVRVPSADDVRGHFAVCEALETEAAARAALAVTGPDRQALMALVLRADAAAARHDAVSYLACHRALHLTVAKLVSCELLAQTIARLHDVAAPWWIATASHPAPLPEHGSWIDAVTNSGSPKVAADTTRAHLRSCRDRLLSALEPYFNGSVRERLWESSVPRQLA